ncbi:hypothetical protein [Bowmanella dokdonensis]|uniref:Uncharacterized protein n=1 Tax=Bowmanella dokdonensis TaxID=751969 RepID=A0A939DMG7_9ALTE|nr:hypothetical protein [Bowmanella dokdonensis]MBN7825483.1 hypothetical protein [Bowmanella dokdonensis]
MSWREFRPHGHVSFSLDGRILTIEAEGPGNAELIHEYQQHMQAYRQQLQGAAWASLVIFNGESLLTPDAIQLVDEAVQTNRHYGMVATAVVVTDASCRTLVRQLWSSIYCQAGTVHQFFDTPEQARQWLLEKL